MNIAKLSIIVPVYNEEKTIREILARIEDVDFCQAEKEIIIIDDGSKDNTVEILQSLEQKYKIFYHEKNRGKGAAVRTGFAAAMGDYVVVQDADLEYDPADLKEMLKLAEEKNAPVVYGSRRLGLAKKRNPSAGRAYYFGGVFLSFLTNLLYGSRITDEPTCYKMIKLEILDKIDLKAEGFEFCPEITAKILRKKIPIYEVPISYHPRSKEQGKKIRLKDGLTAIWTLLKYKFID